MEKVLQIYVIQDYNLTSSQSVTELYDIHGGRVSTDIRLSRLGFYLFVLFDDHCSSYFSSVVGLMHSFM